MDLPVLNDNERTELLERLNKIFDTLGGQIPPHQRADTIQYWYNILYPPKS